MDRHFTQRLYKACLQGNLLDAANMIQRGADLNARLGNSKETPLHVAVRTGHSGIVGALLQAGAHPSIGDSSEVCPVHIASHTGQYRVIERLIQADAEVDVQDESGKTALHFAVDSGQVECLEIVLKCGASVNLCDAKGFPPLYYATFRGTADMVRQLLAAGADVTQNYSVWSHHMVSCPLQFSAAMYNKDDILEAFVASGRLNLDQISPVDKNTLLTAAVEGCRLNQMLMLLENGASPNALRLDLSTPLHVAVENKSDIGVKALLCAGANANLKNCNSWSPFELSILNVSKVAYNSLVDATEPLLIFKLLISCGADLSDLNAFSKREAQMFLSKNPEVMYLLYETNSSFPREIMIDFPDSFTYNNNSHISAVLDLYSRPLCLQQLAANAIRVRLQPYIFIRIDKLAIPDSMKRFILLSSYL